MVKYAEMLNLDKCKFILSCPDDFIKDMMYDPDELDMSGGHWDVTSYIQSIKAMMKRAILSKGELVQSYQYSKRLGNCGRLYVKGMGIQKLQCRLRGFLASDYYRDYDMVNCQPTILLHLARTEYSSWGFQNLQKYVDDRDNLLSQYKVTKKDVIVRMFSDKDYHDDNLLLKLLNKDFAKLRELIWDDETYAKYRDDSKKNKKGSFLSTVLCIAENNILQKCIKRLAPKNVAVPMFDGFLVNKDLDPDVVIAKLESECQKYGIKWIEKKHDTSIVIDNNILIDDDVIMDYETAKCNFEQNHFIVTYPLTFCRERGLDVLTYGKTDFGHLTENLTYQYYHKGDVKEDAILNKWLRDRNRREYEKLDFIPSHNFQSDTVYNTFRGFEFLGETCENFAGLESFREHLRVLVNYDGKSYEYLVNYLAHLVQKPDSLPGVALLFKSGQGVGKDLMIDFIQKMLGKDYIYRTEKLDEIFDKFNGSLKNRLVLQLNEVQGSNGYAKKENLKNLITANSININEKNLKPYTQSNFMRVILFSNNLSPIDIPHDDRRYCVFQCGNKKPTAYYQNLLNVLEDRSAIESICHFLKNVDISKFRPQDRPITEAYQEMKEANRHPIQQYLYDICSNWDNFTDEFDEGEWVRHKKTQNILIKPQTFQYAFKCHLQSIEATYIRHDQKTLKLLLATFGIHKKAFRIESGPTTDFYIFRCSGILDSLKQKGFEPQEVEILEI